MKKINYLEDDEAKGAQTNNACTQRLGLYLLYIRSGT